MVMHPLLVFIKQEGNFNSLGIFLSQFLLMIMFLFFLHGFAMAVTSLILSSSVSGSLLEPRFRISLS
jgi:hypothetical protein